MLRSRHLGEAQRVTSRARVAAGEHHLATVVDHDADFALPTSSGGLGQPGAASRRTTRRPVRGAVDRDGGGSGRATWPSPGAPSRPRPGSGCSSALVSSRIHTPGEAGGLLRPARLDTKTSWGDRSSWCGEEVSLVAVELQVSVGAADAARTALAEGRAQQQRVLSAADQVSAAVANAGTAPALAQFLTEAVHCRRSGSRRSPGPRCRLPRGGQPVDMVDRWSAWEFVEHEGSATVAVRALHNAPPAASA